MSDEALRLKLKHASSYASQRLTTTGVVKADHAPRPITLPTLETKRKLDQEIFGGKERQGAVRDRNEGEGGHVEW